MEWFVTGLGYNITLWFSNMNNAFLNGICNVFNFIGMDIFYILIFPLIFWCISKSLGKRLIILTLLSTYIGVVLKSLWKVPRPYNLVLDGKERIINAIPEIDSYSFPSLHTLSVTTFWGYLIVISKKKYVKATCIVVILFAAISRMIQGVSYVGDVIFSILIGIVILILFLMFEPRIKDNFNQRYTLMQKFLLICFFTGAAIVLSILLNMQSESIAVTGAFFGAILGIVLEKEFLNFNEEGSLVFRILRYIIGLIIISIIFYGLQNIFSILEWENNLSYFLLYGSVTFISTFPIPKLFVFMNIAEIKNNRHL